MKALPLRLDAEVAAELALAARIDGLTVADAIRQAIAAHLEGRRADPLFQRRLASAIDRRRDLLEGLLVRPASRGQMLVSSAGTTSGSGIGAAS